MHLHALIQKAHAQVVSCPMRMTLTPELVYDLVRTGRISGRSFYIYFGQAAIDKMYVDHRFANIADPVTRQDQLDAGLVCTLLGTQVVTDTRFDTSDWPEHPEDRVMVISVDTEGQFLAAIGFLLHG